jgi:hypothetical protein
MSETNPRPRRSSFMRMHFLPLVAAVAFLGAVAAADEPGALPRILGKITARADDGSSVDFDAKVGDAKAGSVKVLLADVVEVVGHRAVALREVQGGTLYVLGKWIPGARRAKPRVAQVTVVVWSEDGAFYPPPIPKALADKGLQWVSGPPTREGERMTVQAAYLDAPPDRKIIRAEASSKDALAVGRITCVELREPAPAGAKELKPERLYLTAPEIPTAETKLALGM